MDAAATVDELETDRLLLRAPAESDVETWAAFLDADPDFLQYVPRREGVPSRERAERTVRSYLARWQTSLGMGWAVALKDTNELIGFAGVDVASETDGEIDYFFARKYWRRGYASEVTKTVTDHWFSATNGQRLVALVIPENVGSVRAVAKLGYRRGGSVNYLELMGNPEGVRLDTPMADEYTLTREDWLRGR